MYIKMTALEQLKSILNEEYISEDDDEYKVELKPGLTDQQIDKLATQLPSGQIPSDIRELRLGACLHAPKLSLLTQVREDTHHGARK